MKKMHMHRAHAQISTRAIVVLHAAARLQQENDETQFNLNNKKKDTATVQTKRAEMKKTDTKKTPSFFNLRQ